MYTYYYFHYCSLSFVTHFGEMNMYTMHKEKIFIERASDHLIKVKMELSLVQFWQTASLGDWHHSPEFKN